MFSPNGIRAVLFDLDGTLRYNCPSFHQATCEYAARLGVEISNKNNLSALRWLHYYWAQSPELLADLERFGDSSDLFWQNHARLYLTAFGCQFKQANTLAADLHRCMSEDYKFEDWVPPEVFETLQTLHHAGYKLAVASNRIDPYDHQLEDLGMKNFFQFSLAAGQINSWKPDIGIFNQALQLLNTSPEQTLYVGDNYFADVVGAQNARLTPVLLDPEGIFPEATCPVIHNLGELCDILNE
ncbi:MAG: HAD family hydrolase [Anaerolineales bacterium]|nr:HAD family hydrolase [Anaerolineales bacterium]